MASIDHPKDPRLRQHLFSLRATAGDSHVELADALQDYTLFYASEPKDKVYSLLEFT
jgi:hypothetical protein